GPLQITGPLTLSGNALTLSGDVGGGTMIWNVDLKIGAPMAINANGSTFNGAIDVNGQTLTITVKFTPFNGPIRGSGNVVFYAFGPANLAGGGDFSGNMTGAVNLLSDLPNATLIGGGPPPLESNVIVGGHGSVGRLLLNDQWSEVEPSTSWT